MPRSQLRRAARRWLRKAAIRALVLGLLLTGFAALGRPAVPLAAAPTAVSTSQVAVPAAPMGWASWNTYASSITYATIKAQADALVSSGMAAAGYKYVNIDEGWWQGARDSSGNISVSTTQWPGGMAAIASYIHGLGLKAGIYTDAGKNGCGYYYPTTQPAAANTGSEGHYQQDLTRFQNWGFDYVKVDWCGGSVEGLDQQTTYQAISTANAAATATTGRKLVLSACEWGTGKPWNWGAGTADLWRTSTDLIYWGSSPTTAAMLANFDKALHPAAQHTGYYNDPDMLTVGMSGFTAAQNRTEMSLWAISGAPLLAGNNLTTMTSATAAILSNAEAIAVDQDSRGLQGTKVAEDSTGLQVYSKILAGTGKRAVVLLNRTSTAATITARWADLGLTTASASVRNVWSAANLGSYATSYSTTVPAGEAVLLTVSGTEATGTTYTSTAALPSYTVTAAATGTALADISYSNTGSTARRATLQVNGQYSTVVSFPPTASGTVSVLLSLAKGSANTVALSAATGTTPTVNGLHIQAIPGSNGPEIVGTGSGRCADLYQNTITNGTQAELWDCSGGQNQSYAATSRGELVVYGNKCLDAYNNGTTNGTVVDIWDCNSGTNQKWTVNTNGTITSNLSGLCLDATGAGTANGTTLELWTCNGAGNQQWTRN
ncbi:RICIN domain-containing protein [Streptacidiphilus sp. EB103A]|uniref:RICIN domain-containing protein n=1 Tax=Streptacidiphilus sp. EB103A TaxID=3156275 RepID=UPI003514C074